MLIRLAEVRDRDDVWTIFHEVVAAGETYPFAPDTSRDDAMGLLFDLPKATYVAETNGEVVGLYYLKDNYPGLGSHVCNAGYMVRASARRGGVGRAMCEHSFDAARQLGYLAMQYNLVVAANVGAVALWRQMGFEIVGTLPKAFRHARLGLTDALVMYRWL
ncbi:MAG: GNAT family N-acetyltransferase [Vicinamibacterales bacterium]|jgi:L-amino acid N-acyltransferase YncA|nr:GNAT family N-acetyltransferase [Acidobacteriota bacterium]MDP7294540.1 GNAT family N-acetyltransferase [Vicinamibacterales bacterium]MDP7473146.1 GNAT family N-acetyltransferase [Vicinamibacterales bacterium]MDP7670491.1 GNAT family N-acetyltransferase [Vicinamibacterales bacterium]HJO38149.1 GNAT family N-acetyltransferase [Vicinamibacterales bacterium]|tara:strand:- start:2183 stop:2665 length:483 start_codon:yes stop_codon:yes gene_type:complete